MRQLGTCCLVSGVSIALATYLPMVSALLISGGLCLLWAALPDRIVLQVRVLNDAEDGDAEPEDDAP